MDGKIQRSNVFVGHSSMHVCLCVNVLSPTAPCTRVVLEDEYTFCTFSILQLFEPEDISTQNSKVKGKPEKCTTASWAGSIPEQILLLPGRKWFHRSRATVTSIDTTRDLVFNKLLHINIVVCTEAIQNCSAFHIIVSCSLCYSI